MASTPAFSPRPTRELELADDRLKSALLSRFILAGLSERDAQEAANLVSGFVWICRRRLGTGPFRRGCGGPERRMGMTI
jgi:hypothetical protein